MVIATTLMVWHDEQVGARILTTVRCAAAFGTDEQPAAEAEAADLLGLVALTLGCDGIPALLRGDELLIADELWAEFAVSSLTQAGWVLEPLD